MYVYAHIPTCFLLYLKLQFVYLSTLSANDNTWTRSMDDNFQLVDSTLYINRSYSGTSKTLL
ncbi:hypothetical protein Cabther_A1487 [Chloracidobacterium thermophilum B]|uniref:Uncharacterized protein n=1 Tax=Chloracidobacterium thermophilum (strain B) TaxID=981222 RepID=G2LHH4_CHLTF|nr:hypothetical protein Cabther_A1487 [Chloracidobacterium thermophilum B]